MCSKTLSIVSFAWMVGMRFFPFFFFLTFCSSVGSVNNMNKLSLVGMQLPEKYKENFNVSSEGPSSLDRVDNLLKFFRLLHHYQRKLVKIVPFSLFNALKILIFEFSRVHEFWQASPALIKPLSCI